MINMIPDKLLDSRFYRSRKNAGYVEAIPTDDPRITQRTMSPDQFRLCMLALDMEPKELRGLFCLTAAVYHNWSSGRTPLPKGVADYLRLRVAQRIRAMSIATGTPIQVDEDLSDNPSAGALAAIEIILENLKAYLGKEV